MPFSIETWHQRYVQQAVWTSSIRQFLFSKIQPTANQKVLEVGCGTGAVLSSQAQMSPAKYFGMDIDRVSLQYAKINNPFSLTQADAHSLPYCSESFNLVYCHFLLLWLKDPLRALKEMIRVTCSRGTVLALGEPDYGGRIDYPDEFSFLGQMQTQSLRQQGAEPLIGRQLGALFSKAGLQNITYGCLGGQWQPRSLNQSTDISKEWDILYNDMAGQFSETELNRIELLDQKAWINGERVLYVPTFYAIGYLP
jgi:ubiquinone/menaquinone biosynthesis C-methylase UbiE